eukprot:TRINITY_DN591_c0_g1_i7.p1 TRINITY_DN591_c0_g1~~TRINITY_DN591_c0_g1_i7.p1  ORF type:complete len:179 (+),score=22.52 TRINITY_DN591_c0_g1_i7:95-631(+)
MGKRSVAITLTSLSCGTEAATATQEERYKKERKTKKRRKKKNMERLRGWVNGDNVRELRGLGKDGYQLSSSFMVPSPSERMDSEKRDRLARSKICVDKGVQEGAKASVLATVLAAVPTIFICRTVPWAKANLNYTAQALIISAASISTYFVVSEHTIMECGQKASKRELLRTRALRSE